MSRINCIPSLEDYWREAPVIPLIYNESAAKDWSSMVGTGGIEWHQVAEGKVLFYGTCGNKNTQFRTWSLKKLKMQ
jgi:hypothetical protein